jgi:uncharacterized OB-fold protein
MRTANATGVSWNVFECPDCGHMRDPDWEDCYYCGISDEQKQELYEEMWQTDAEAWTDALYQHFKRDRHKLNDWQVTSAKMDND